MHVECGYLQQGEGGGGLQLAVEQLLGPGPDVAVADEQPSQPWQLTAVARRRRRDGRRQRVLVPNLRRAHVPALANSTCADLCASSLTLSAESVCLSG